jgi:septum site-determining protein MinD
MLKSDDILEILNIKLLGKVPEDRGVIDASNQGKPVILDKKSIAGQAYTRITGRLCGQKVDMKNIEVSDTSLFRKLTGMFK